MVEIRTYEDSPEALREFVVGVWRESYGGRMAFPLWTPDYFRWQLALGSDAPRSEHLLAAYDGGRLVGALLGFPTRFRTPLGERDGTQGSWLSIARDYRRQGIATMLRQELRRRHLEQDLTFQIGFGYFGSPHSLGPSFWKSQRELGTVFLGRVGFWARVLDATRAARWNVSRWEGLLTRTFGRLTLPPREKSGTMLIREYRPADLPGCLELIAHTSANCDLSVVWSAASLQRQLEGGGVGRTLIAERDGIPVGFVNWHSLCFLGRTEETVSVIDLSVMPGLSRADQHRVLSTALSRMRSAGAALALKLRIGDHDWIPFVTTGFVPRLPDSYVLATWGAEPEPFPRLPRMHLLWR